MREALDGGEGEAVRRAAEILLALARVFNAPSFVPVGSAQISGVSYRNLSDAGLEFLESFARGARVRVRAMLNPAGMDRRRWREMGVSEAFAEKQERVLRAYEAMGVGLTCTCTPYLAGCEPGRGEILAWGESSAVTYVNSVLGARSNREGGPAALAAAILGETPLYGLHLDENRVPNLRVIADAPLADALSCGALGMVLGEKAPGALPLIESDLPPTRQGLKALSAALPTYSGVSLFHWKGVTPEWDAFSRPGSELVVKPRDLEDAVSRICDDDAPADLVFLGCPHLGADELGEIARELKGKKVRRDFWIFSSAAAADEAAGRGFVEVIESSGARVFCDTCPVVAPLPARLGRVLTDSAKGCYYLRGAQGRRLRLATTAACIRSALDDE
jgi:predicted aconitase